MRPSCLYVVIRNSAVLASPVSYRRECVSVTNISTLRILVCNAIVDVRVCSVYLRRLATATG